jgi:hypothetical protein
MVQFKAEVLEEYAVKLIRKAGWAIASRSILGLIIGLVIGIAMPNKITQAYGDQTFVLIMSLLGAFLGFLWGKDAALMIQVQAQQILCQVAIERNTRGQVITKT